MSTIITPTPDDILSLERDGLVTVRPHGTLPLRIVNYTPRAQYERAWTPALLQCRGIVFDERWHLVARPFPKFFNYEEHIGEDPPAGPLPNGDFTVTEKYDGSLGIVFRYDGRLVCATRGTFHSGQAEWAMAWLRRWPGSEGIDEHHTHLFEIIHPGNRIVVDYGNEERLQWLASIHTASGAEADTFADRFGGIARVPARSPEELKRQERANAEGYVLRFANGQRVKVKFAQYVELHRLVTGLSTTSIWECLRDGNDPMRVLTALPDELYGWAEREAQALRDEHARRMKDAHGRMEAIKSALPGGATRREFAELATKEEDPQLLFMALDGNTDRLGSAVWKLIEPERRVPVNGEGN